MASPDKIDNSPDLHPKVALSSRSLPFCAIDELESEKKTFIVQQATMVRRKKRSG
jgi:hypothetical protein